MREDLIPMAVGKTIWDELPAANIDTQKLEHLFESRAKDFMTKVGVMFKLFKNFFSIIFFFFKLSLTKQMISIFNIFLQFGFCCLKFI